jgi:hypothetical protein
LGLAGNGPVTKEALVKSLEKLRKLRPLPCNKSRAALGARFTFGSISLGTANLHRLQRVHPTPGKVWHPTTDQHCIDLHAAHATLALAASVMDAMRAETVKWAIWLNSRPI